MTAVITHADSAGGAVDPTADIDGASWDAPHTITGVMSPAQGGTGVVNNDASTITISGSFGAEFTLTAATSVTFPTTGTLATLAGVETLSNKTLVAPALGTPASGVMTNVTGLPISTGLSGAGTGVLTALGVNVGSAGAFVVNGGALGTPSSGTLTNATGLPVSTGISGFGTGVATALGVNVGSSGAFVTFNGALGTPSSGTLTNATGLPVSTGISGLASGIATFLATPSSANLRSALTDEVGTGSAYFTGGALGTPASGTATNLTGLPISTGLTGAGTGVLAALAVNVGSAGAPVLFNGAGGTPSSMTLTNATGLPLAGLTNQAAYSILGNFTGSSAAVTASTIPGLSHKTTPVGADTIMLADSAASNALKYSTLTELLASVGAGVSSIAGNTGAFTLANGIDNSTNQIQLTAARRTLPTVQTFTSGTAATYTTPANCLWIEVYAVGGGGGGAGASSSANTTVAGSNGGTTSFNSVNAAGGTGATGGVSSHPAGGAGGTGGSGTATRRMAGHVGEAAVIITASISPVGAYGGGSALMGGGAASVNGTTVGNAGVANTGGGGSGGSNTTQNVGGAGGGGGESFYLIINSPASTYTYTVGAGGAGGVSTTNGGAGAAGYIQVIEHYGS